MLFFIVRRICECFSQRVCPSAQSKLVSPSGRDVAQRQRGLRPSDIAFQICPDTNLPAFCPLSHLLCKCQLSQGESREAGANCTPDASGELLRRLVRVLLLLSRLAPRHLPQGGRLFLLCVHAGIKKDCHQAVPKYYLFSSTGNVALSKSPARTCRASAILYKISSENGRTMFGASMELK